MSIDWVEFIAEAIRMATPLIFAALAAMTAAHELLLRAVQK